MGSRDDEDLWVSYSSQERLTRADPRKDILKKEIEAKQGKQITDKESKKLKELKTKVNLKELQSEVAGKNDAETKRAEEEKKHETFGTKTRKQEEERQVTTAKEKPTSEKLIQKEDLQQKKEEQAKQEYQQDVG